MGTEGLSEDQEMSELSIIDRNLLQRDQDYFADVSGLFLFAIDSTGRQITDISGRDMRDTNRIAGLVNEEQIEDLFKRVMHTKLEEQVIENTEFSNMKIAAVAIKSNNHPVLCFIVCAVYYEPDGENAVFNIRSVVDENVFYGGLDFLREIYNRIYDSSLLLENEKANTERLRSNEKALEAALRQSESMTRIVELLDSDERFEDICEEITAVSGRCAGISHTYILAPDFEAGTVETRGRYRAENADPVVEKVNRAELLKYAASIGGKPMVVSSRTEIDYDFRLWLGGLGIISFVVLPIFSGRQPRKISLYIVFADNDPTKLWSREDIKFFGDVAKVLQSIYDKRISKESLTSSYVSLKVILNNVGSYICVRDKLSGQLIFVNKKLEEDFSSEIGDGSINTLLPFESDGNDLRTELAYKDRLYELSRNVIKWIDGRYAVLYSFTEKIRKVENVPALEDKALPEVQALEAAGTEAVKPVLTNVIKDFRNISVEPKVLEEFLVYYQPIIDIMRNNKCIGAEALMRWSSKSLGFMQPGMFLPNARQSGIIVPIGNYMLKSTCRSLKKWNESGHPYFKAHVNFAPEQLLQENFIETLTQAINETGVNPRNLVLEFSDSFGLEYLEDLKRVLAEVKILGCQIALDDFGTGSFSFNQIKELPLGLVKIGQDFVKNLTKDLYVQSFIRTTGEFLDTLKIKLCVEGIESRDALNFVSNMKVRNVQGFCFDAPMSEAEFEGKYLFGTI